MAVGSAEDISFWTTIIVPLLAGTVPAIITYFGVRHQTKKSLESAKVQQATELEKIKEQSAIEREKMQLEIERIREQATIDLEKMQLEIDKQAELYEKNAQVDVTKDIFGQMLAGDTKGLDNIFAAAEKFEQMQKMQARQNHPVNQRRRK